MAKSGIAANAVVLTGGIPCRTTLVCWRSRKKGSTALINRDDWNTYGCHWDADKVDFTVNGQPTHTYPRIPEKGEKQWPFNQPFYFILSMQIGGNWVNGSGSTNPSHYPAGMEVDWIRVCSCKLRPADS